MDASEAIDTKKAVQRSSRGERRRIVILAGYMEWILTPAETGGHYCMLESFIPPRAGVPPHQHADQEALYVMEGALEVAHIGLLGLEWFPVTAGDSIHVPSNEIHGFRNTSNANARTLVTAAAGLGRSLRKQEYRLRHGLLLQPVRLPRPILNGCSRSHASTATASFPSSERFMRFSSNLAGVSRRPPKVQLRTLLAVRIIVSRRFFLPNKSIRRGIEWTTTCPIFPAVEIFLQLAVDC